MSNYDPSAPLVDYKEDRAHPEIGTKPRPVETADQILASVLSKHGDSPVPVTKDQTSVIAQQPRDPYAQDAWVTAAKGQPAPQNSSEHARQDSIESAPKPDRVVSGLAEQVARLTELVAKMAQPKEEATPKAPPAPMRTYQEPSVTASEFWRDPMGSMNKLQVPKRYVAGHMLVDELGDKVDPAVRAEVGVLPQFAGMMSGLQEQIQTISAQIQAMKDASETAARQGEISSFAQGKIDQQKFPTLAKLARKNAAGVADYLRAEATDARTPVDKIAERVEKNLALVAPFLKFEDEKNEDDTQARKTVVALPSTVGGSATKPPVGTSWQDVEAQIMKEILSNPEYN